MSERRVVRTGRFSKVNPSEQVAPPPPDLHMPNLRIAATQAAPEAPEIDIEVEEEPKISERPLSAVNEHGDEVGEYQVRLHPKKDRETLKLTREQADGKACILCGNTREPLIPIGVTEGTSTVLIKCEGRCQN